MPEGSDTRILAEGSLPFTIESRLIRELGERLVRQPDVAMLELVKNAYDADATHCTVTVGNDRLVVLDDGNGMTFADFRDGWMRLGTSSKGRSDTSPRYGRAITGEKGIGRLAVRYLGRGLSLVSVAFDTQRGIATRLEANFDWDEFDRNEDLGAVEVPYTLSVADGDEPQGTRLTILEVKDSVANIDWKSVRTASMGVVSPVRSLLQPSAAASGGRRRHADEDPGFSLVSSEGGEPPLDAADALLSRFFLRAVVRLDGDALAIEVFQRDGKDPFVSVRDTYANDLGFVRADIRFFPRRAGLFAGAAADGRESYSWIRANAGVKVFDRGFQMRPYGTEGDDWLALLADASRNLRKPASSVARTHFAMPPEVQAMPALNWMLRLPEPAQLVGVVQVEGRRQSDRVEEGLTAAADREGFLANKAFDELRDVVRGAVEMIAYADREIALDEQRRAQEAELAKSREATRNAIAAISSDRSLTDNQRSRIVEVLEQSQDRAERLEKGKKQQEQQLEVMSLLGVVAGFMTHEFGVALTELTEAKAKLQKLEETVEELRGSSASLEKSIQVLQGFVRYSRAYIGNVQAAPSGPFTARGRLNHVRKAFAAYAEKRDIDVEVDVDGDLQAPLVPAALYDGIAQNLLTNALKAVTASQSTSERRIVFRAWNEGRWHHLQVSDTGVGIPEAVRDYVFDPLFTTTDSRRDPLGSGMGLGLALVRRGAAAFGGQAALITPPPGFSTCVEVRFPMGTEVRNATH